MACCMNNDTFIVAIAVFLGLISTAPKCFAVDDHSRGAAILILQQYQRVWYTVLLRNNNHHGDWNLPGGYSKVGEHRNFTGARELKEETNGGITVSPWAINFGYGKPFQTYINVVKGHGVHLHQNITFVAKTRAFQWEELHNIAKKMRQAPHGDGYRETDGIAVVDVQELLHAVRYANSDQIYVPAAYGFVFDYHKGWHPHKVHRGTMLKISPIFKRSMTSYLPQFEQMINAAKYGPEIVYH